MILGLSTALALVMLAPDPVAEPDPLVPNPGSAELAEISEPTPTPYVRAGVGGGAAWARDPSRLALGGALTFGVEAGAMLRPRPRLALGLGAAFFQTGHQSTGSAWPSRSNTDLLAKLRVGGIGRRAWGYGIGGLGIGFATEDGGDYVALDAGPVALFGMGVRFSFRNDTTIGLEAESAVMWIPPDGLVARVTGSLVLGWAFGGRG